MIEMIVTSTEGATMSVQPPAPQRCETTPIILANRRMRALWPWSVPGCPFPFQAPAGGDAPVVTLIRALEANPGFGRPVLVIAPDMLQSALGALNRSDCQLPPPFSSNRNLRVGLEISMRRASSTAPCAV